jgi:hypothetical protein
LFFREVTMALEEKVFAPRPTPGWRAPILMAVFMVGPLVVIGVVFFVLIPELWPLSLLMWVLALVLGVPLVVLAWWFTSMRYVVTADSLHLRYGPMDWRVDLASITRMEWRDLGFANVKTVRTPSLALGNIHYVDPEVGWVKMCATSAHKRVLLIEAGGKKYGVTPADEEGFVAAVQPAQAVHPSL